MNGVLSKTKTYLIGHMQYGNGSQWRAETTQQLNDMGVVVMDPYNQPFLHKVEETPETHDILRQKMKDGEYGEVAEHMKKVRNLDLSMVDRADFLICYVNPDVPTYGTIEELSIACQIKRPVFVAVEGGKEKTPFWVMGMLPHNYIYDSVDEIIQKLRQIHSGQLPIDSDRWRLFEYQYR